MMNNILQEMLSKYNCSTKEDYINAFKEIVQEIALYSLSLTDFFDNAAFYGGTALRIFYNLKRFSEDLDFSLCSIDANFDITKYFSSLTKTFETLGLNFAPQKKVKTQDSNVQSAFLKGNTLEHILLVNPKTDITNHIQKSETIKIKFEIDTNPPSGATYVFKYNSYPIPYKVKMYDESSLFAGKVHAVLCRNWKNRIKGRDLYDLAFYLNKGCILNIKHLEQRMIQTGNWNNMKTLMLEDVKYLLKKKIKEIDLNQAKKDVIPFIQNSSELNIWSIDYFDFLINKLMDNRIIVFKIVYDLSEYGNAKVLQKEAISSFEIPDSEKKSLIFKNIQIFFNKYIISDDLILNFGQKSNCVESYYLIVGFKEEIHFSNAVDINKLLITFK